MAENLLEESFLGLDIGTSSVKALLVDQGQRPLAEATAPLPINRPRPLWSEQDPADWWRAIEAAVGAVRRVAPDAWAGLRAIGLSGQMHGAVLLNGQDRVLRPAILWNDGRNGAECQELERLVPDLRARTSNRAMPGFTAPKLLWVRRHEPEVFAATRLVLLPKDWVRLRLTGGAARLSDISDAASTLWLDVARRRWDATVLEACGLSEAHMPGLVEGSEPAGVLCPALARDWELNALAKRLDALAAAVPTSKPSPNQNSSRRVY